MVYVIVLMTGIILGTLMQLFASACCRDKEHKNVFLCENCSGKLDNKILIPIAGYFITKGKCPSCNKNTISVSLIDEILSGICMTIVYVRFGLLVEFIIFSLFTLVLIAITYVDFKIYEIPIIFNIIICILGIFNGIMNLSDWKMYVIGFFAMSLPIYLLIQVTGGRAMGGGDAKLLATAGLLLGWKLIILSFFLACILGAIIHSIRIKLSNESHELAFGPYLALGMFISLIWGDGMIGWYLSLI